MRAPIKSTNVRPMLHADCIPALLAAGLWVALAAALAAGGALERLEGDVVVLALFACFVAGLAYALDREVRRSVDALSLGFLLGMGAAIATAMAMGPVGARLAAAPIATALAASAIRRARTAAAALPGAMRAALSGARNSVARWAAARAGSAGAASDAPRTPRRYPRP